MQNEEDVDLAALAMMANILPQAETAKIQHSGDVYSPTRDGLVFRVQYGASTMQGWRANQEDFMAITADEADNHGFLLFSVFDGHGGAATSHYCQQHFHPFLLRRLISARQAQQMNGTVRNHLHHRPLQQIISDAFLEFDANLPGPHYDSSAMVHLSWEQTIPHFSTGSTATTLVVDLIGKKSLFGSLW